MRKLLFVSLPAGVLVFGAVFLASTLRSSSETADAQLERARLKRDFAERAALAKAMPVDQPGEWQAEVEALSRWYFDELAAIRNRHPKEAPLPTGLEAAEKERKGKLKPEERAALEDFQKYADARLDLLRNGSYAVVSSLAAEGLRLDMTSVEPGSAPGGGQGLRIEFGLWGAGRYLERERSKEVTVTRNIVPIAFKQIAFRFLDASGKLYGEMNGPGEPYQKLSDPERFSDEFPPGVLFGTWWVDLFPREAVTVELDVAIDVRAPSGALRPLTLKTSMPVPEAWKIPPGAVYQAEAREAEPTP